MTVQAQFPAAFQALFQPYRYKVYYGGRGSAKSWNFARALLLQGGLSPQRILCVREIQKSIDESVHQLLRDKIEELGMSSFYKVQKTYIEGQNGSLFLFAGLRHNIDNIKSKEGIDKVWAEEAHAISKDSWDKLVPTIRKEASEIWVSLNPELDTDETYVRFIKNPPPDALIKHVTYRDNPWFPEVLRREMEALKARDFDAYLNVWEGHCKQVLDGAIYAKELREATAENRITRVPYDRSKPIHTFWDLGRRDLTAIWFAQLVGFEYRVVDFYENRGQALDHYLKVLQDRGYVYGEHWLPHDAENELLASKRTIAQQMREVGHKVRITPKVKIADGIAAARSLFPNLWFDADKCADGLNRLRRYRYDVDENGQFSRDPLHDDNSNAADALRYLAVAMREPTKMTFPKFNYNAPAGGAGAWMA